MGGAARYTSTLGKTATFRVTAYDVGLVMDANRDERDSRHLRRRRPLPRASTCGIEVTTFRQLVFARHFAATRTTHTIEIRPTGTGRVDIDAFVVLR